MNNQLNNEWWRGWWWQCTTLSPSRVCASSGKPAQPIPLPPTNNTCTTMTNNLLTLSLTMMQWGCYSFGVHSVSFTLAYDYVADLHSLDFHLHHFLHFLSNLHTWMSCSIERLVWTEGRTNWNWLVKYNQSNLNQSTKVQSGCLKRRLWLQLVAVAACYGLKTGLCWLRLPVLYSLV